MHEKYLFLKEEQQKTGLFLQRTTEGPVPKFRKFALDCDVYTHIVNRIHGWQTTEGRKTK